MLGSLGKVLTPKSTHDSRLVLGLSKLISQPHTIDMPQILNLQDDVSSTVSGLSRFRPLFNIGVRSK